MGDKIKLELLWTEDFDCPDGNGVFPEVLYLKASRRVTDADKEEIGGLVKAEIEKAMKGCPEVKVADDCDYEVGRDKDDHMIICIRIFCPLRVARARAVFAAEVLAEAWLEALGGMSASDGPRVPGLGMVPIRAD